MFSKFKSSQIPPEARTIFYDEETSLPKVNLVLGGLTRKLHRKELGLIVVDIAYFGQIDEIYATNLTSQIKTKTSSLLKEALASTLTRKLLSGLVATEAGFAVFVSSQKNTTLKSDLLKLEKEIKSLLQTSLRKSFPSSFGQDFGCYVGSILLKGVLPSEQAILQGLREARAKAVFKGESNSQRQEEKLRKIIVGGLIHTVYQPMVNLKTQDIVAYEVLARGPERDEFERPDLLFAVARQNNFILELEKLCRQQALEGAKGLGKEQSLFINVDPDVVADQTIRELASLAVLSKFGLRPDQIILELSEEAVGGSFDIIQYLRQLGFRISIDDASCGYLTLRLIGKVKPQFIKPKMMLVRGVAEDKQLRKLLDTFVDFSRRAEVELIALGVETFAELEILRKLGVKWAQGYLLAYPSETLAKHTEVG